MAQVNTGSYREGTATAVVLPAYNEEKNIRAAVENARAAALADAVYVVDGASTDRTARLAAEAGAHVLMQEPRDGPAKGQAIRLAVDKVDADVLVFFDADLRGTTPDMIDRLARPILDGEADHVVGTYTRKAGRVTELTARPLLRLLFPQVQVRQPLAGEFAFRRDLLRRMEIEPGWGVESGILIDSHMNGNRVVEVDLGHKEHDMKDLEELKTMAQQVAETIVKRAVLHGRLPMEGDLTAEAPRADLVPV